MDQSVTPKSSLPLRVLSAAILMPVTLFCLVWGGVPFMVLVGAAAVFAAREWVLMSLKTPHPVFESLYGCVYILFCIAAFASLRMHYADGAALTFYLVLAVWATDTGAYFFGKAIGGPKMAPLISPNKTWAGLAGGVIASVAVLCFFKLYIGPSLMVWNGINFMALQSASLWQVVAIGAAIAIVGQIGDLFISMQKRKTGVKDTGHLIPGHGGILDRIDSLLLAAPAFIVCLKIAAQ